MKFLLDTNVISETRRAQHANPKVRRWLTNTPSQDLAISALVAGEIWRGIEAKKRKDALKAAALESWFDQVLRNFAGQILVVDEAVAHEWARRSAGRTKPIIDTYLAATALVHGLTVATRNTKDFAWTGVPTFDPFVG